MKPDFPTPEVLPETFPVSPQSLCFPVRRQLSFYCSFKEFQLAGSFPAFKVELQRWYLLIFQVSTLGLKGKLCENERALFTAVTFSFFRLKHKESLLCCTTSCLQSCVKINSWSHNTILKKKRQKQKKKCIFLGKWKYFLPVPSQQTYWVLVSLI